MKISLENILANALKNEILEYMEFHPSQFEELIQLAITDNQPHSARAAWLLSKTIHQNDSRVQSYIPTIISMLTIVKDGQARDFINTLFKMEINEEQEGILFDNCVNIWCELNRIPSVRYNAFKLILQITQKYPALHDEVILLSDDYYIDSLSSGIKKSLELMLQQFTKKK